MKNYFKYIAVLALGVVSCEPELENSIEDGNVYSNGQADFSNYVALGNSLTAGYADGALYISGQENAYPNILAEKFAMVQETEEFTIPYVNDNNGGLLLSGNQIAETRYVLSVGANGPSPVRLNAEPTTEVTNFLEGPFSNMGVPGAKSYHLLARGYGSVEGIVAGTSNPYYARFATTSGSFVLEDALTQQPTFFSLWIGNNDVLGYATSGGTGEFQMDNTDFSSYGQNDITDPNAFAFVYNEIAKQLSQVAGGGVLLNIPNVTNIPYFNTIPNNALALDAATAQNLTGFFQAVAGVMTQVLMQQGASQEQAQAIASQYAIQFSEGANRFLIDVPVTQTNPLGFRQMTEEELLLLPIDRSALAQGYGSVVLTADVQEVLAVLQSGGQPTQEQVQTLFGAVSGIDDKDVLDMQEIQNVETATTAYNNAIAAIAQNYGLALVDVNEVFHQALEGGIEFDGGLVTAEFVTGGAFSLDGVHLTPRGNAIIANEIIEAVNAQYGSEVPKANIGEYGTVTLDQNN